MTTELKKGIMIGLIAGGIIAFIIAAQLSSRYQITALTGGGRFRLDKWTGQSWQLVTPQNSASPFWRQILEPGN